MFSVVKELCEELMLSGTTLRPRSAGPKDGEMPKTIHPATVLTAFAFAIPFTTAAAPTAGTTRSYDVVIAGAGTGGFGAAMQAARIIYSM